MAEFKLPKLRTMDKVVDTLGRPSIAFVNFFLSFSRAIETQERTQDAILQEIIEINDVQAFEIARLDAAINDIIAAQAAADAAQADVDGLVPDLTALADGVQVAQATGNAAQDTADLALGLGTVSGSATDPSIDLTTDGVWVEGPQVDLTSVLAGDLTITGSGPVQDDDVSMTGLTEGEYRIVEDIGGVDTVLYTGLFTVVEKGSMPVVKNVNTTDVAAFVSARSSTGAVTYRIDARKTSGSPVTSLALYVYARRAA